MLLDEAISLFLKDRLTYCSDSTVKNYNNVLGYLSSYLSSVKNAPVMLSDITSNDLFDYSIYLRNKNKQVFDSSSGRISSRTRKDYLKAVKTFFNFCYENNMVEFNVSDRIKLPRVHCQPTEVLSSREAESLFNYFDDTSYYGCRNICILHCLLDQGMRSIEVQHLELKDVSFERQMIVIRNSKGGKGRVLPMSPVTSGSFEKYLQFRNSFPNQHNFFFSNKSGNPLTGNSIKCIFDDLKKVVPRVYPHLCRHTFGTSFIMGGGSVEVLRVYMGHSSIETTQVYMHIANEMGFLEDVYHIDPVFKKRFY